jgi:uncharacterized metal-binding protein YceD (DUF177 family)
MKYRFFCGGRRAMKVNVLDVRERPRELDFELMPQDLALDDVEDIQFIAPIVGHFKFSAVSETILARGQLATRVRLTCVRCLEEFDTPLECRDVQLYFAPAPPHSDEEESIIEVRPDEEEVEHFQNNEIDLTEELRELLLLECPSYPHCPSGCEMKAPREQPADQAETDESTAAWKENLKNIQLD